MMNSKTFDDLFAAAEKEHIKIQDKLIEQLYEIDHVSKPDPKMLVEWEAYLRLTHLYFSHRNNMPVEERVSKQHDIVAVRSVLQGMIDELELYANVKPMAMISQTKH